MKKATCSMAVLAALVWTLPASATLAQESSATASAISETSHGEDVQVKTVVAVKTDDDELHLETDGGEIRFGRGDGYGGIGGGGGLGWGRIEAGKGPYMVQALGMGGNSPARTLVIGTAAQKPEIRSMISEDLAVMSRILEKALAQKGGGDDELLTAMNIQLFTVKGSQPFRSMYLDGYGAVFFHNVRFPLMAPTKETREEKTKKTENSTWEQAKRELYGPDPRIRDIPLLGRPFKSAPQEKYDEQKVEQLKNSLLQALKNASNIRQLKSEDSITVVVTGGQRAGTIVTEKRVIVTRKGNPDEDQNVQVVEDSDLGGLDAQRSGETVLSIRVKKSDVDAFAKGDMNFEQFQNKAAILVY